MQSIKKNFFYQAAYELLIVIMPLITSPYVSRVLGASNIGVHSYTYTMANYFVLFSALGIKNYGNREISRVRDDKETLNKTFSGIFILHFLISVIVAIAYAIYTFCIAKEENRLYVIIQGLYVISAIFDISWLFFGLERFKITVTRNSAIKIISTILIFAFVNSTGDLWKYSLILALSNFLGQLYLWKYTKKYVKLQKVNMKQCMVHLPQMAVLFIPTVAISIYNYMDKIMVGGMSGTNQLGFYENAEKIIFVASSVIGSVGTVMLPRMSNITAKGDVETRNRYIEDSMIIVMFMSAALGFGIASVSSTFSVVFWGNEFAPCGILLTLLSIILPIKGFANVLRTQFLIPSKFDKAYTLSVCMGALVNLIFNYLLIPVLQAAGAAIGTILAELTVCLIQIYYCKKDLSVALYLKNGAVYIGFGALMYLAVYFTSRVTPNSVIGLLLQIAIGACVYIVLFVIYIILTKSPLFFPYLEKIKQKLQHNK